MADDALGSVFKTDEEKALELRKLKAEVAKLEGELAKTNNGPERVPAPPSEPFIVKSDGSKVSNPNYVPPKGEPTVKVPTGRQNVGPEGQDLGAETTTKSLTQATFDRQSAADLQAAANEAKRLALEEARNKIASDKMTADQALAAYNKELDKIRLQLEERSQALTERSQDVNLRGQDVSAGVSQRGQDMDYSRGLAQSGTQLASALLPYLNAGGQIESTNSLMAGGPPVATRPTPPPFTPELPLQLAQQAQAIVPSQYILPGAPARVPAAQYVLPSA